MADAAPGRGLRTIFSFFLGLMLTAFVGVGVYTFYPPPDHFSDQIRTLTRREQAIRNARSPNELTPADRDSLQAIERQRNELVDAAGAARIPWGRTTSIILIAFATLAMVVSLIRADQAPVIGSGLLLGGLFTMLYGVGWIIATDTSIGRFFVMTVALVITLALGYLRFVRRGAIATVARQTSPIDASGLTELDRRVCDLEKRMSEAAAALTPKNL